MMFYPAYIHKDADSAYGVTPPDFPGCFSAADDLRDLPRLVQEAVEVYFEGESITVPPPSSPEKWANDERFQGGYWMFIGCLLDAYWMLVDIDLSTIRSKIFHLDISLREPVVCYPSDSD